MTDKPQPDDEKRDEALRRMLNTPKQSGGKHDVPAAEEKRDEKANEVPPKRNR